MRAREREKEGHIGKLRKFAHDKTAQGAVCPCEGLFYFSNEVLMFRLTLALSSAGGVIARGKGPRSLTHTASGRAPISARPHSSKVCPTGVCLKEILFFD